MKRSVNIVTILSCIGMFLVLVAGVVVTKLDAGRGCGYDWPLCNGKFVPAYTLESILEFNHRFITGIVGIIVVAAFILVWRYVRDNKEAVFYATTALFFTVFQALLGAAAVKWPQSDAVLALHFGFSLIAFASTLLLVIAVRRAGGQAVLPQRYASGYQTLVWVTIIFCYIVVYLGAFVRHSEAFAGCLGWPLCNGKLIPELTGATAIVFTHRLSALIILILISVLTWKTYRDRMIPDHMRRASRWALFSVILQVLSGAVVTLTLSNADVYVFMALIHTMIIAVLFSVLCYMTVEVWKGNRIRVTTQDKGTGVK